MDRKYQIFVSSTYDDLRDQRNAIVKAILEMGHIPVGMEMFSAADEEQWRIITSHIERSDYYVLVIAHRYGSTVDGLSFTEKEYDYSVSKTIPVLGFIIEDSAPWPRDRVEQTAAAALDAFKQKVKRKPVSFWLSTDQLAAQVAIALSKQITAHPRPGWIRGDQAAGPEVLGELARLSSENAELRERVAADTNLVDARAILDALELRIVETEIKNRPTVNGRGVDGVAGTWLRVDFHNAAPHMLTPFTFQIGVVMSPPVIDLLAGRIPRAFRELAVKTIRSGDSEITYVAGKDFSILPGAWETCWIGLLDHEKQLVSPVSMKIRIFSPAGTRDFDLECVIPAE